jgi:P-type Ca2+ transporter type 2C
LPEADRAPDHALPARQVLDRLGSGPRGLAAAEAARRLAEHGANELPRPRRGGPLRLLLRQAKDVMVAILAVAVVLSLLLGHRVEAAAIAVIALFSILLGFFQEARAERALEALQRLAAPRATVLRDGARHDLPARELVPGDLILLEQGNHVPADARLVEAAGLGAVEAPLTGESEPVTKSADAQVPADAPLGDRRTMVFAGTTISQGRGRAVVVATGTATEVGRIGRLLGEVEQVRTPLERQVRRLARALVAAGAAIVLAVVGLGILRGQEAGEMLLFGVALAVAVVPEALPAVITISLALGAQRMARRNALVRRLPTVETLGSTTVVCTDKTGTLTAGAMRAVEAHAAGRAWDLAAPEACSSPEVRRLLEAAALCNDGSLARAPEGWTAQGDPTEAALLLAVAACGLEKEALDAASPRVGEVAFTSERKRMTTLHRGAGGTRACMKGAVESVLEACAADAAEREAALAAAQAMAARGLRVLAVAEREDADPRRPEQGLRLLGLAGLRDPPRPEAAGAIATCHAAGIRPVMITGDHPATAVAVARELGILRPGGEVVSGPELEAMDDARLREAVARVDVYARVSPEHKLRIVTALQGRGEVVAMTGDGVNDAPALRRADIGIAMGIAGTDVAKGAADMMLADDNFATIVAAVEEGRAIFDNVRKYLVYLLSTNLGEIALIAAAMLAGLPLPLSAVQLLYVNLASDGLPALALAVEPHERDLMRRQPRPPGRAILDRRIVAIMVLAGLVSAATNLGVFAWALAAGKPMERAMTMVFASLILVQFVKAFVFRSERHSMLRGMLSNRWLDLAVAWEVLLLLALVHLPWLNAVFGTVALTAPEWGLVVLAAVAVAPPLEFAKWLGRRAEARGPALAAA